MPLAKWLRTCCRDPCPKSKRIDRLQRSPSKEGRLSGTTDACVFTYRSFTASRSNGRTLLTLSCRCRLQILRKLNTHTLMRIMHIRGKACRHYTRAVGDVVCFAYTQLRLAVQCMTMLDSRQSNIWAQGVFRFGMLHEVSMKPSQRSYAGKLWSTIRSLFQQDCRACKSL